MTVNVAVNGMDDTGPLRPRRLAVHVSQRRLAELAGCSETMVRQLEGGYKPSYGDVLARIVRTLETLENDGGAAGQPRLVTTTGPHARYDQD